VISFGKGPFGPVSALVVSTIGMSKSWAMAAWAMMLFLNSVGSKSRTLFELVCFIAILKPCTYDVKQSDLEISYNDHLWVVSI
jgi:hypothetical protein